MTRLRELLLQPCDGRIGQAILRAWRHYHDHSRQERLKWSTPKKSTSFIFFSLFPLHATTFSRASSSSSTLHAPPPVADLVRDVVPIFRNTFFVVGLCGAAHCTTTAAGKDAAATGGCLRSAAAPFVWDVLFEREGRGLRLILTAPLTTHTHLPCKTPASQSMDPGDAKVEAFSRRREEGEEGRFRDVLGGA